MTLSPPVRAAVLEVVRRLRDPMRECHVDNLGYMVCESMPGATSAQKCATLEAMRLVLGLPLVSGSLAQWARGKSREEVAAALERIETSGDAGR